MSAHLQRAISSLMRELIALSARVEESMRRAVQSLQERDIDMARLVEKEDEIIDAQEIDIEEECLKIFALHQPVAIDLRYLVAALKINNDLERIGDLAVNISQHVAYILANPTVINPIDFQEICAKVQAMVKQSLDALVNLDAEAARQVLAADDDVDRLNWHLHDQVVGEIKKNPDKADVWVEYIHIVRNLERIADHATNIAEDIIYLIKGEIVRHSKNPTV